MILADKIIQLRKKNGWSQEELASRIHVSRQSVSKWEGAQSVPDLDKVLQLSQLFGVSTDYLLKDEMEVMEWLETDDEAEGPQVRRVSMQEASDYLALRQQAAKSIALATFLCMLSPVCLLFLTAGMETGVLPVSENFAVGVGLILMALILVPAVAIYMITGARSSAYQFLEKEIFETEYGVTGMVKERQAQYRETYTRNNVLGTCICICSVIPLFAGALFSEEDFLMVMMVCCTLALAGIGVIFFIVGGVNWAALEKLLQEGDYLREKKKGSDFMSTVAGIYWMIATAIYLGWSFWTNDWQITWILWPVAGVLYGAVAGICSLLRRERQ